MTTFLSYRQPAIATIRVHRYESAEHGLSAVIEFDDASGRSQASFHIDDLAVARQLLATAGDALRILDPDGPDPGNEDEDDEDEPEHVMYGGVPLTVVGDEVQAARAAALDAMRSACDAIAETVGGAA